ncbi:hypothetical protein DAA51_33005 [Bradyrhizobium sp. WBAH10]|nr:hypothetical protein [Bradyrhizobium sp. WBAH30]MDD1546015.1 hypothetical protein [Bradyrhizobium sp. WBAH41]MDD1559217.1 hypothetical protein [Bradyrhizobium sp. WBAH23]MDD1566733.1 hypothetical protein [Bradyrhizobium sp. WBAH33]MDD1592607.1 hypothetical protein [Bradyrhizobium sp. WBAH42]NRB90140.1 hypothetical protein [Bradyrhizobium sp. WBAH10]QCJ92812.1 hypothetical protein DAA57_33250 [Bradyrhizobium yuanmingense]
MAEGLQNALWWLGGPAREHRTGPRLLSDNGSNCVADDLAEWLDPRACSRCEALRTSSRQGRRFAVL